MFGQEIWILILLYYYCYISWKCVKLSKNGDPDKYVYSGYGIGLNVYS